MKSTTLIAWMSTLVLMGLFVSGALGQQPSKPCPNCVEWNRPQKPFRIFGNTYYVGTHALSSILITSDAGHVLIDGDFPESVPQITDNIHALGFRVEDVRLILNSHVHFDHAGGIAELQRLSRARVVASPWSAAVMSHGGVGRDDPQYGTIAGIAPIKNVEELHDREILRVGTIALTAHVTPGHTPGGTSWTWKSCDGKTCHDMVFADSLTPVSAPGFRFTDSRQHPHVLDDFEKSLAFLEATPCDVLVSTHPELSDLWERLEAREKGVTPDPMVQPDACRQSAQRARERLQQRLAEERAQPAKTSR